MHTTRPAGSPSRTGRTLGVWTRAGSPGPDVAGLAPRLVALGWTPVPHPAAALVAAARAGTVAAAIVPWPFDAPGSLTALAAWVPVVTLHRGLDAPGAAAAARHGAIAAFDVATDPAVWLPSLTLWIEQHAAGSPAPAATSAWGEADTRTQAISTALGLMGERYGLTIDQAFARLRMQARSTRRRLDETALAVLEDHERRVACGRPAAVGAADVRA